MLNNNVAIRVDASALIGTGHFMRCLTLADVLKKRGAVVRFVSRHLPTYLCDLLIKSDHEFVLLGSAPNELSAEELAHSHWLGVSQQRDAQDTVEVLGDKKWGWLVVDHYALDATWESTLRQIGCRIFAIDDLADRKHNCDVLLDQNYYLDMDVRYFGKAPKDCRLLLGPRYSLLREEFLALRRQAVMRVGRMQRVLVFFGGIDACNHTGSALAALVLEKNLGLHVDVVIGSQHPARPEIEHTCEENGFACHVQTSRMAELMADADFSIGAGGIATWERCCLGLPTLAVPVADNQVQQLAAAASQGWVYVPDAHGDHMATIRLHLKALHGNSMLLQAMERSSKQAVDGRGVARVAAELGYWDVSVRAATIDDSKNLLTWRNDSSVRAVSRNSDLISWEDHQRWLQSVLFAPDKALLIGERGGVPIGVVRYDTKGDDAEVSIYLVPAVMQPGTGGDLLRSATDWLAINRPDVRKISAFVRGGNERSQRLFIGAGYQILSTNYLKKLN